MEAAGALFPIDCIESSIQHGIIDVVIVARGGGGVGSDEVAVEVTHNEDGVAFGCEFCDVCSPCAEEGGFVGSGGV